VSAARAQFGRQLSWAAPVAVAVVAVVLYLPSLGHGFAFDDVSEVVRNQDIRSLQNLPRIFSSGAWDGAGEHNPIYRPLTSATYAVDYVLGGSSPTGFHATNVLLHALASALLVLLARRMRLSAWAAAAAGVLFALHPVHVEAVANIAGRKDVLVAVFTITAVLAHDAAVRRGGALLVAPLLAFAGALFSKENGAAALGVLLAWDVLVRERPWRDHLRRALALYAAYIATLVLYFLARRASVGSFDVPISATPFVENPLAHLPAITRVLTAVAVLGRGLLLQIFPHPLSPDYSFDAIPVVQSAADPRFVLSAVALLALCAAALGAWRTHPRFTFLAAWYAAEMFPTSNLLVPIGTIFGERLLYVPSVASCLAIGALLDLPLLQRSARGAAAVVSAFALLLAGRAVAYERAWSSELALFTEAVHAVPASAKAHELLGAALMEEGRFPDGVRELETAVELLRPIHPGPAATLVKLGVAYERVGRLEDAARVYGDVLREDPLDADALWRLGVVRWAEGRADEAVASWRRALEVKPDHARAMSDLAIALYQRGDVAGAEQLWLRAVQVDPRAAGAWLALGNLYARRGDQARAKEAWIRFVDVAGYGAYTRERELVLQRLRAMGVTGLR
jgi:tetratricopeptide (TPR) repeat protein